MHASMRAEGLGSAWEASTPPSRSARVLVVRMCCLQLRKVHAWEFHVLWRAHVQTGTRVLNRLPRAVQDYREQAVCGSIARPSHRSRPCHQRALWLDACHSAQRCVDRTPRHLPQHWSSLFSSCNDSHLGRFRTPRVAGTRVRARDREAVHRAGACAHCVHAEDGRILGTLIPS